MALAVVSVSCPPLLSRVFGGKRNISSIDDSTNNILKTLVKGSVEEVKTTVESPNFSLSVTQMQHLDLPRDVRRGRNKLLVFCLGESQATAFIILKEKMNMSTAQKVIQVGGGTYETFLKLELLCRWKSLWLCMKLLDVKRFFENFPF